MTSLITRCPKCATAFNVTDAHLNSANGAVRCGSCLNVFNGREHLTDSAKKTPAAVMLDDELFLDDELSQDEYTHNTPEYGTAEAIIEPQEEETVEVEDDESWVLKLLEDEGHSPSQLGLKEKPLIANTQAAPITQTPSSAANTKHPNAKIDATTAAPKTTVAAPIATDTIAQHIAAPDASPAPLPKGTEEHMQHSHDDSDSITEEDTQIPMDILQAFGTETPAKKQDIKPAEAHSVNAVAPTQAARKASEYAATKAQEPEPEAHIAEQELAELQQELEVAKLEVVPKEGSRNDSRLLVDAIEVDAVELQYTGQRPAWLSRLTWLLLAILATTALIGQIAWLKFDELSVKEPYRQYYGIACEHLGCTLAQLKDLSKIRTTDLLVRTHPTRQEALLVDVVIQNHATFEQPFPKLTLVFSNIKNKIVASRAFNPSEYLGGDLAGADLMPAQKAIHLSLELVDPGKGAVSYKITINE
ncbi:DUF3426 domain-containing protein [Marinagarivorans algicola]|uniref:DUF3426 domain-containing protein n=1 Tax=Marinagarivorans algicola TaxID=1513270 RepID=UPI0006B63E23|nr:DUF3426 domain-containing protein [Marinagarivorans algicola]